MKIKTYINGKETLETWGCFLEEGSRDKLFMGVPLKEFIENKSRLNHGKRVLYTSPMKDSRDIELVFCFTRKKDFLATYVSFLEEMYKGEVELKYEDADNKIDETFHLTYLNSRSLNTVQHAGKASIRFDEPNPNNRKND